MTERFDEINERLRDASLRATFFSSITNPATRFVNSLVYTGVGIAGAFAVVNGSLSVGQLSSFLSYANQYTKPFNEISGVVTEFQNAVACARRIFDLIEEEPQTPDPEDAADLTDIRGNVRAEDVSFSYLPEQKLIEYFNLEVRPGQRIAIVGPTGCGKTTLINLLMRFYDVDEGRICVEDIDIREMTRQSLRAGFGMVRPGYMAQDGDHPGKYHDGAAGRHGRGSDRGGEGVRRREVRVLRRRRVRPFRRTLRKHGPPARHGRLARRGSGGVSAVRHPEHSTRVVIPSEAAKARMFHVKHFMT